jgi:probable phosphoglycerate mutase
MTIYVVRHGRTEANASGLLLGRADPRLDDTGRQQAQLLAGALPAGARVVSSPLQRCVETARIIGATAAGPATGPGDQAQEPETDHRLVELDYGRYDLMPIREIPDEVWVRWRSDPDFRPPDGETLVELATRVGELLDQVAAGAADDDVVLVTHVTPIKAAMAWALGVGIQLAWRSYVAPASITRIGVGERGPSLLGFNIDGHLASLGPAARRQVPPGWRATRSATDQQ